MSDSFSDAVAEITRRDPRFAPEAFQFLREALEATLKRRKKIRKISSPHVTAAELLDGFRLHALQEFGPMARTVLDYWGVRSCEDIGEMVWALIEAGALGSSESDSPEDFRHGFDFEEAFDRPFRPQPAPLDEAGGHPIHPSA